MSKRKNALTGLLFILPSFFGILIFLIIPFFQSVYYSFTKGITDVKFVWFENFGELFGNPTFTLAVKNTAIFMGIGVPLLFILALAISLAMMNNKFVFERWALLAPLIVPIAAVVLGFRFLLGGDGLISGISQSLGFGAIDLLGENYAMPVVIAMFIWKNLGYLVVIFTSAIAVLPKEYLEVFRLESKSGTKLTFKIILPLITPMAFFALIIAIMNSFKIFREIHVMYGSFPPKSIYMLQHFMNNNFFKLNYQRLSAAAFLVAAVIFIIIWLFLKLQNRVSKDL